jgi:hypothetical protein
MRVFAKTLQIIGAISLVSIVGGVGFLAYVILTNRPQSNVETRSSTAFALRWSGLDPLQDYQVIESFRSEKNFTGDHLDYFCVKLGKFSPDDQHRQDWTPAAKLDATGREAFLQARDAGDAPRCFNRHNISLEDIQIYVESVTLHTGDITAYDVLLFDQRSGRLLYVSEKT